MTDQTSETTPDGLDVYRLVEATDGQPWPCTIVDGAGRSVLASHNGTPVFASRAVADLVLRALNAAAAESARDAAEERHIKMTRHDERLIKQERKRADAAEGVVREVRALDLASRRLHPGHPDPDPWRAGWNRALEVVANDLRAALAPVTTDATEQHTSTDYPTEHPAGTLPDHCSLCAEGEA